jgi:hypothetical protein
MIDSFDDFAEKHSKEQQDREKLANDTEPEWFALKGFVEALAQDGKGIDNQRFAWVSDDGAPRLVLDCVTAMLLHHEKNGVPKECRIRFDRKPPGPSSLWHEKPPLEPVVWSLESMVVGDSILWSVPELGERRLFSSLDLAHKIGTKLAEFHLAYKKHYEKWSPV